LEKHTIDQEEKKIVNHLKRGRGTRKAAPRQLALSSSQTPPPQLKNNPDLRLDPVLLASEVGPGVPLLGGQVQHLGQTLLPHLPHRGFSLIEKKNNNNKQASGVRSFSLPRITR
jgi:hypothetical protein